MAFFWKRKNHSGATYLTLDIGTEVIKALVCAAEGRHGRVIGVGKAKQNLSDMQGGTVMDIESVIKNCLQAIKIAVKQAGETPHQMVMGIAGELVKGATTTTSYLRKDPTLKIDLAELKNIVHKVQWKAFDVVRSQMAAETGYNEIDVKLVHAAIVDICIDGYRVHNPIGFQGKEVSMGVFNAFAPLVHFGALQTIAAELEFDLLGILAEPYAISQCLKEEEDRHVNAIFIDVGGGTTDIAVVRNSRLEGTKMFTLGGRTFTKRLAQSLNVSFPEAEQIKLAYSSDTLEKQSKKIVRDAMKSDCEVWLSGVALTLGEFEQVDLFPGKIYLCGGGSHLPEIREVLETREWVKTLPFHKKPQITLLHPKMIKGCTDDTKLLKDLEDVTPLALASSGLELVGEEPLLQKILKKVVRLMQI